MPSEKAMFLTESSSNYTHHNSLFILTNECATVINITTAFLTGVDTHAIHVFIYVKGLHLCRAIQSHICTSALMI